MTAPMPQPVYKKAAGFSYVELMLAVTISAILVAGLMGVVNTATLTGNESSQRNKMTREARFAMQRMVAAVSNTRHLVIPMPENPLTLWSESLRRYPPRPAFPNESAVLAMHLDPAQDLDGDGFADADNDRDGAIDEDPGGDSNFDLAPGLVGIDDDNDGFVDEQHLLIFPGSLSLGPLNEDDDEDNYANEDLIDGIDNDGDGKFDEDIKKQTDGNDLPGVGGVDDDGDGLIDEGDKNDDDEDGVEDEDWYDTLVFYLVGNRLMERRPVPWDANLDGVLNGLDPDRRKCTGASIRTHPGGWSLRAATEDQAGAVSTRQR